MAIILVVGMAIFYFGLDYASDKVIDTVTKELESSGKLEEIKKEIENDPELVGLLKKEVETSQETSKSIDDSNNEKENASSEKVVEASEKKTELVAVNNKTPKLAFQTKEEAIKVVIGRVGISNINNMVKGYREGTASKEELIQEASSYFSAEEMKALKIIAYNELTGQ